MTFDTAFVRAAVKRYGAYAGLRYCARIGVPESVAYDAHVLGL